MDIFMSTISGKIDTKGRVSIPSAFRQVIVRQNKELDVAQDIVLLPSYYGDDVEVPYLQGGGSDFLSRLYKERNEIDLLSDHDLLDSAASFSETIGLKYDSDGRVSLPPDLIARAEIERDLVFVGMGFRFHIWSPENHQQFCSDSRSRQRRIRRERSLASDQGRGAGGDHR